MNSQTPASLVERVVQLELQNAKLLKKSMKASKKSKKKSKKVSKKTKKVKGRTCDEDLLSQFIHRSKSRSVSHNRKDTCLETVPKTKLIEMIKSQNLTLTQGGKEEDGSTEYQSTMLTGGRLKSGKLNRSSTMYEQSPYFVNSSFSQKLADNRNKKWVNGLRNHPGKTLKRSSRNRNRSYLDYSTNFENMEEGEILDRQHSLDLMQEKLLS